MTTPQPEATAQKSARELYDNLSAADQLAMRRAINVFRALEPIYDAVNRSVDFTRRTSRSLSEGAQSLVSQTQQYGRDAAAWAGQTRTDLVDRAADLRDRVGVTAEVAATRVGDGLDSAGRAITDRATATRDAVVSGAGTARDAVVSGAGTAREAVVSGAGTARDAIASRAGSARDAVVSGAGTVRDAAVNAGQRTAALAGRASRWFQEKVSTTAARAAAGYHAVKEFNDLNLNAESAPTPGGPEVSATAITAVSAQVHAYVAAQSPAEQQTALQALAELNARGETMSQNDQAIFMAALSGNAPAAGAVNAAPTQAPDGRSTPNQPGKGPDLGK